VSWVSKTWIYRRVSDEKEEEKKRLGCYSAEWIPRKMATKRLIAVLRLVHSRVRHIYNHYGTRCCELCHEFVGDDEEWQTEVVDVAKPLDGYLERIKAILATRGHVVRDRQKKREVNRMRGRMERFKPKSDKTKCPICVNVCYTWAHEERGKFKDCGHSSGQVREKLFNDFEAAVVAEQNETKL